MERAGDEWGRGRGVREDKKEEKRSSKAGEWWGEKPALLSPGLVGTSPTSSVLGRR